MDPIPATWSSSSSSTFHFDSFLMDDDIDSYSSFSSINTHHQPIKICPPSSFFDPDDHDLHHHHIDVSEASRTTATAPTSFLLFSEPSSSSSSSIRPIISSSSTAQFISFGNSSPSSPSSSRRIMDGIVTEPPAHNNHLMKKMICFQRSNDLSASIPSSSSGTSSSTSSFQLEFQQSSHDPTPVKTTTTTTTTRTPLQAKYHVMAERRRREKLVNRFKELSNLIPGLKKLDKTSVLDGAINHLTQLEERLKALEDQETMISKMKKKTTSWNQGSAIVATENSCVYYLYQELYNSPSTKTRLKISRRNVLITVDCEKTESMSEEDFVTEIEKLDLSVTECNFLPFGDDMVAVSVVAQMKERFCMAEEELADKISLAILKLTDRHEENKPYQLKSDSKEI